VKIQEADAKSLLIAQGLPVPGWEVVRSAIEARRAAERAFAAGASLVVVKAQVLVGGRGKAGGVKVVHDPAAAEAAAAAILALEIKGIAVRKLLVGPAADIVREYYLGAILDRVSRRIVVMASAEGGVEIIGKYASYVGGFYLALALLWLALGLPDHRHRRARRTPVRLVR